MKHLKLFEEFNNDKYHVILDTTVVNKEFKDYLKTNNIDCDFVRVSYSRSGPAIYIYIGTKEALTKLIIDWWGDDLLQDNNIIKPISEPILSWLTPRELESQKPNYIVSKTIELVGEYTIHEFDLIFLEDNHKRCIILHGENPGEIVEILNFKQLEQYLIKIDSPEGKEFMHSYRGKYSMKRFGV